jgi:hypothetical protein
MGSRRLIIGLFLAAGAILLAGCGRASIGRATGKPARPVPTGDTAMPSRLAEVASPTIPVDIIPPRVDLVATRAEVSWEGQVKLRAVASDNVGLAELQLLLDGEELASSQESTLDLDLVPADTPGINGGGTYTFTARATDLAGNTSENSVSLTVEALIATTTPATVTSPTPGVQRSQLADTPTPNASPTEIPEAESAPEPQSAVELPPEATTSYIVTKISIPTYPYTPYVSQTADANLGDYPVLVLDRAAYDATKPQPAPRTYTLLVLENEYLRLSVLPELGGRLYECVFKPTGNNEFYRNPVIKPTGWGPPSPPSPAGANWWLAAGGMEWDFPVAEHGYEWATSWGYDHVVTADGGVMVTVFTRDPRRPYAVVDIILPSETAYFIVRPRIVNPGSSPFRLKWWHSAMLAPGAANAPGPELRFIFPTDEVTVHSTGDPGLPGPGQVMSWPVYNGRDMSRLGNWTSYLGFFQRPVARGGYMGVYDLAVDEGIVRVYPPDVARGAKAFAPGWSASLDPQNWTDDGSGYVELHGGLAATFNDWYELPPGGEVTWSETWYPVAHIGNVTYAAEGEAINLSPAGDRLRVGVFPTIAVKGQLKVTLPGMEPVVRQVQISPASPFVGEIPYAGSVPTRGEVALTLTESGGATVFTWQGEVVLR